MDALSKYWKTNREIKNRRHLYVSIWSVWSYHWLCNSQRYVDQYLESIVFLVGLLEVFILSKSKTWITLHDHIEWIKCQAKCTNLDNTVNSSKFFILLESKTIKSIFLCEMIWESWAMIRFTHSAHINTLKKVTKK